MTLESRQRHLKSLDLDLMRENLKVEQWRGGIQVAFWMNHFRKATNGGSQFCFVSASLVQCSACLSSVFLYLSPLREGALMEREPHGTRIFWRS